MNISPRLLAILLLFFIVNCGSASSSNTSTTTDTTGTTTVSTSIAELIDGGIQVDSIENELTGTWVVKSYDLGESSSIISVEDNDVVEIEFTDESDNETQLLRFSKKTIDKFSVPPLFEYEENTIGPKSLLGENGGIYIECTENDDRCQCASTDHYCVAYEQELNPDNETITCDDYSGITHEGTCYTIVYGQTNGDNLDSEDFFTVDGLHDPALTSEVIDTGVDPILKFSLTGIDYARCSSPNPGGCANTNTDFDTPINEVRSHSYIIKGMKDGLMAIENGNSYVVMIKN